jgi:hypothetical protein
VALMAACFLAVGIGRLPLLLVMPVAAAIGILAARRGWL